MTKQQLIFIKGKIEEYKKDSFEYQQQNGFDTIFDELYDSIYEIEKIIDNELTKEDLNL